MSLGARLKTAFTSLTRPYQEGGAWFYPVGSANFGQSQDLIKDFTDIPELNAVINWKARAFANMELKVVNRNTLEESKSEAPPILYTPNWFQAQGEFLRQTKLFHDLFGNEYLYALRPSGMSKVKGLFTLPPNLVSIKTNTKEPFFTLTENPLVYSFEWNGRKVPIDTENLAHLNDNRVEVTSENYFKGTSKAAALREPLRNIRSAYNARGANLRNLGALGIISSAARDGIGSIPLLDADKEKLQADIQQNYGALSHQFKYILSTKAVDFTQISTDLDKLKTFEEVREDFDKIMDAYGLTKDIFSSAENSTFTNKKEAEKQAYLNAIIPEAAEWLDALNKLLGFNETPLMIHGDFSQLPVFQTDKKDKAQALNLLTMALSKQLADGAITVEEYKQALNEFYGKS